MDQTGFDNLIETSFMSGKRELVISFLSVVNDVSRANHTVPGMSEIAIQEQMDGTEQDRTG